MEEGVSTIKKTTEPDNKNEEKNATYDNWYSDRKDKVKEA